MFGLRKVSLDSLNSMPLERYIQYMSLSCMSFYRNKNCFQIRPEWRIEDLFVLTDVQNALYTDSLFTTRQMTLYKETPSDILALYDNIAYAKGRADLSIFT